MLFSNDKGESFGPKRLIGIPSELHKNLAKFHFKEVSPVSVRIVSFKKVYSGWVFSFSQSIFPNIGKVAPFSLQNSCIAELLFGSCPPKSLL